MKLVRERRSIDFEKPGPRGVWRLWFDSPSHAGDADACSHSHAVFRQTLAGPNVICPWSSNMDNAESRAGVRTQFGSLYLYFGMA